MKIKIDLSITKDPGIWYSSYLIPIIKEFLVAATISNPITEKVFGSALKDKEEPGVYFMCSINNNNSVSMSLFVRISTQKATNHALFLRCSNSEGIEKEIDISNFISNEILLTIKQLNGQTLCLRPAIILISDGNNYFIHEVEIGCCYFA